MDATEAPSETRWVLVVPVKPPARGKSRLRVLPDAQRVELARAFALDTVTAGLACAHVGDVVALTDDFRLAAELAARGCTVLPDGAGEDLNASLVQAAREADRRWPGRPVAALCADLPALRPADLDAALAAVPTGAPAYVADAVGAGTTMYAARSAAAFAPRFGVGSAAAHAADGAVGLDGDWPSLRQDVDEVADLGRALVLGVGPATARATGR